MWKNHRKSLIACIVVPILIVLLLLVLVWVFEYLGIHVPGTREMWIGLIGAVIGGAFTLIGVLMTIYSQEETEEERRRLESMPILGFKVYPSKSEAKTTYTYMDGEMVTSAFKVYLSKEWSVIEISVVNKQCAFDFTTEEIAINGKCIPLSDAFAPSKERVVEGENTTIVFDDETIMNTNLCCVIRFSYNDMWGNKYYQDLPFTYCDGVGCCINGVECKVQNIEIRDVKPPILVNEKTKCLVDSLDYYVDFLVVKE